MLLLVVPHSVIVHNAYNSGLQPVAFQLQLSTHAESCSSAAGQPHVEDRTWIHCMFFFLRAGDFHVLRHSLGYFLNSVSEHLWNVHSTHTHRGHCRWSQVDPHSPYLMPSHWPTCRSEWSPIDPSTSPILPKCPWQVPDRNPLQTNTWTYIQAPGSAWWLQVHRRSWDTLYCKLSNAPSSCAAACPVLSTVQH